MTSREVEHADGFAASFSGRYFPRWQRIEVAVRKCALVLRAGRQTQIQTRGPSDSATHAPADSEAHAQSVAVRASLAAYSGKNASQVTPVAYAAAPTNRVSLKLCGKRRVRTASATHAASSASAGASGGSCTGARSPLHVSTARARPGYRRRAAGGQCSAAQAAIAAPGALSAAHSATCAREDSSRGRAAARSAAATSRATRSVRENIAAYTPPSAGAAPRTAAHAPAFGRAAAASAATWHAAAAHSSSAHNSRDADFTTGVERCRQNTPAQIPTATRPVQPAPIATVRAQCPSTPHSTGEGKQSVKVIF